MFRQQIDRFILVFIAYPWICACFEQRLDHPTSGGRVVELHREMEGRVTVELGRGVHVGTLVVQQQLEHFWRGRLYAAAATAS